MHLEIESHRTSELSRVIRSLSSRLQDAVSDCSCGVEAQGIVSSEEGEDDDEEEEEEEDKEDDDDDKEEVQSGCGARESRKDSCIFKCCSFPALDRESGNCENA